MFDLGIQELVVIFVVALLVFGPKRLPELARTMGKGFGQLRKAMFDIKAEVEKEMDDTGSQIPHDIPGWKRESPDSQDTAEQSGEEDMKGLDRKEYDDISINPAPYQDTEQTHEEVEEPPQSQEETETPKPTADTTGEPK